METQDSKGAARAAWGIYIMRRIMCALGRTFFSSHEKSGRWFAMEAKEKELRRSRPRWSRLYVKKFRETDGGRESKGKGTWMHRDARNSALRRETRLRLVEKRDYIPTFRVESRWIIYFASIYITWTFRGNYHKKMSRLSTSARHAIICVHLISTENIHN